MSAHCTQVLYNSYYVKKVFSDNSILHLELSASSAFPVSVGPNRFGLNLSFVGERGSIFSSKRRILGPGVA